MTANLYIRQTGTLYCLSDSVSATDQRLCLARDGVVINTQQMQTCGHHVKWETGEAGGAHVSDIHWRVKIFTASSQSQITENSSCTLTEQHHVSHSDVTFTGSQNYDRTESQINGHTERHVGRPCYLHSL